ncbi:MAG: DUF2288 domain-containing protein [Proteobacteria bacterium]|nr:DUF2288 domain-containing protein [Pseudomonadota bacterium]NOG59986.1 DUF2288 domain-containing protein [Pseudomonadota bacterium]
MKENLNEGTPEEILDKINRETSKMQWTELMPFFAKGMAIYVSHTLDLIKVAHALSVDNKEQFETWTKEGLVANVTDEQASAWHESNVVVWATVIKPWILVQPIVD